MAKKYDVSDITWGNTEVKEDTEMKTQNTQQPRDVLLEAYKSICPFREECKATYEGAATSKNKDEKSEFYVWKINEGEMAGYYFVDKEEGELYKNKTEMKSHWDFEK